MFGRRAAVRRVGCLGGEGSAHPSHAGLAGLPAGRRAGVQLPLSGGPLGQHRVRRDEVLREALHRRAGRHRGDTRRLVSYPWVEPPLGQCGGATRDSAVAGQRRIGRGDGNLSVG